MSILKLKNRWISSISCCLQENFGILKNFQKNEKNRAQNSWFHTKFWHTVTVFVGLSDAFNYQRQELKYDVNKQWTVVRLVLYSKKCVKIYEDLMLVLWYALQNVKENALQFHIKCKFYHFCNSKEANIFSESYFSYDCEVFRIAQHSHTYISEFKT